MAEREGDARGEQSTRQETAAEREYSSSSGRPVGQSSSEQQQVVDC